MGDAAGRIQINAHNLKLFAYGETSQLKVRRTVRLGPPPLTVDTTVFELWLGTLSAHQGLSIPVV